MNHNGLIYADRGLSNHPDISEEGYKTPDQQLMHLLVQQGLGHAVLVHSA